MAKRPTKTPSATPNAPAAPRKSGRPTSAKPRAAKKPAPAEEVKAAAPEKPAAEAPAPPPETPNAAPDFMAFSAEQRQQLETLSLNLAKAAMMAQTAVAEAALSQADRP
ncbi:MAG: class I poly(R)-hydroxyalkanoic acid synthase, partial [Proteobacteria bacterium]|nr:class I poly(R)-hydroxyalkanoic acid synthase [Pseudomonadota bacterium]